MILQSFCNHKWAHFVKFPVNLLIYLLCGLNAVLPGKQKQNRNYLQTICNDWDKRVSEHIKISVIMSHEQNHLRKFLFDQNVMCFSVIGHDMT